MTHTTQNAQTHKDISVQLTGSFENMAAIAYANGYTLDTVFESGVVLTIPDTVVTNVAVLAELTRLQPQGISTGIIPPPNLTEAWTLNVSRLGIDTILT